MFMSEYGKSGSLGLRQNVKVAMVGKSDVSQTLNMFSLGKLALARLHRLGSASWCLTR